MVELGLKLLRLNLSCENWRACMIRGELYISIAHALHTKLSYDIANQVTYLTDPTLVVR